LQECGTATITWTDNSTHEVAWGLYYNDDGGTTFSIERKIGTGPWTILTPTLSAIALITNMLCVLIRLHGLFWVSGFFGCRMLCHVETPFCVGSVWNGTGFLFLFWRV